MMIRSRHHRILATGSAGLIALAMLAGCSTTTTPATTASSPAGTAPAAAAESAVLPVSSDPIVNDSTAPGLTVAQALAEDNTDASGGDIPDCLQITISNRSTQDATGLEVYYTMTDTTTGASESYYQPLDGVTIPAGAETTVWFDGGTGAGHFPENPYSVYRSSTNEVDFTVEVSASGLQIATGSAIKSAGAGEQAD